MCVGADNCNISLAAIESPILTYDHVRDKLLFHKSTDPLFFIRIVCFEERWLRPIGIP